MNSSIQKNSSLLLVLIIGLMLAIPSLTLAEKTQEEIDAERAVLKQEIVNKEIEIQKERVNLMNKKEERQSYERDSSILRSEVNKADLSINRRTLAIKDLNYDIEDKADTIVSLDEKFLRESSSLAQILRKSREKDDISLVEILLGKARLSEVLVDVDRFDTINSALQASFKEIVITQKSLRGEQESLSDAKDSQEELRMIQRQEKEEIVDRKKQKDALARNAKLTEAEYQNSIKAKEKSVAQIRARLFSLRDANTGGVSFGTMLAYAKEASLRTDVSPALILGILTVETNLGQTLGIGTWYEDMHPTRDAPVFLEIVEELGLDPDEMPVSARPCSKAARDAAGPGNRCGYGYGGAMGPAQFIPSTWILYKDRIARVTGQSPPNPWDPRTAVFANALLMMDNGADKGTRNAEHKAAVRYLAGWRNAEKSEYWWYGDKTMRWRDQYTKDIAALE